MTDAPPPPARSLLSSAPLVLLAIVALAALLRLAWLDAIPLTNDEQNYAAISLAPEEFASWQAQRDMVTAGLREGRQAQPFLYQQLNHTVIFPLFGVGFYTLRLLSALCGVAAVGAMYALARALLPGQLAAARWAALLLAVTPLHVRFCRSGYLDSLYLLLLIGFATALLTLLREPKSWRAAAVGVLGGLLASAKISAPLFLLAGAGGCCWMAARAGWGWGRFLTVVAVGLAAFAAVFVPLNDPWAYCQAVLAPTDGKYSAAGGTGFLAVTLLSPRWWAWVAGIAVLLLPVTALAFAPRGWAALAGDRAARCLVVLLAAAGLPLLALHSPHLSGEHGLLPLLVPITLLAAAGADAVASSLRRVHLLLAGASSLLFGLSLVQVPYPTYYNFHWLSLSSYRLLRLAARELPEQTRLAVDFNEPAMVRHAALGFPGPVFHVPTLTTMDPRERLFLDAFVLLEEPEAVPPEFPGFRSPESFKAGSSVFLLYRREAFAPRLLPLDPFSQGTQPEGSFFGLPQAFRNLSVRVEILGPEGPLRPMPLGAVPEAGRTFVTGRSRHVDWEMAPQDAMWPEQYRVRFLPQHPYAIYLPE